LSADRSALDLLQSLEQGRELLESQQSDYTATLKQHQQRIEVELQSIDAARGALHEEFQHSYSLRRWSMHKGKQNGQTQSGCTGTTQC